MAAHGPEAVCGPLVGGAFVAHAAAAELDVPFCYSARVGEAYVIPEAYRAALSGRRVAVVDDVVNAGSAVLSTAAAVRAAGGRLSTVGALLVLGDGAATVAAEAEVPVERLITLRTALWTPDECPLCEAGMPLDDVPPS